MRTPRRTTLGPFHLEEKIGEGGMGVVYRAQDPQLRRLVAIKRIHGRYENDEEFCRLFLAEARAVAAVSHRNIAQIFSIHGSEGDDPPFFAMEYVEGLSTEDRVRRDGPLSIPLVVEIALQSARGLRAAHRRGIIHRDVKPSNLLLDERDQVKLVDFGLALRLGDLSDPGEDDDQILCTPHYVSPEQARGWRVDHRSDIYSLGCTLYFLLTGVEPFQRAARVDLFVAHANAQAPTPSIRRPEVPPSLDAVIARMLEKRPESRPADYDVLLQELDRIRDEVTPPSEFPARPSILRRAVTLAIVIASVGAAAWAGTRPQGRAAIAVEDLFPGVYIAEVPYEKLHYRFADRDASRLLARHFVADVDSPDPEDGIVIPPTIRGGELSWSNYDHPIRLPYLSEFREIEIRGLRFLERQDFILRIGDDPDHGEDGLAIFFSIDRANDQVARCTFQGEAVEVVTEPSHLDFHGKEEEYILQLRRVDTDKPQYAFFQFSLKQETSEDGKTAVQADVLLRVPANRLSRGGISIQSLAPHRNRSTVSIEEILVVGTLDRERLAREWFQGRVIP